MALPLPILVRLCRWLVLPTPCRVKGCPPDVDLGNHIVRFPRAGRGLQGGAGRAGTRGLDAPFVRREPAPAERGPPPRCSRKSKASCPPHGAFFFPACRGHEIECGMNPAARVQLGRVTPARGVAFAKSPRLANPTDSRPTMSVYAITRLPRRRTEISPGLIQIKAAHLPIALVSAALVVEIRR